MDTEIGADEATGKAFGSVGAFATWHDTIIAFLRA
jgi:7-keto-8-aminopelargonate synthetase-like enzyme